MLTMPAARTREWRLSPTLRNWVLVLHILMGVGRMGVDITLFALLLTARTSADPILVASSFNAIRIVVPLSVPPLAIGIPVTGLLLGFGTHWGLFRYWWVLVKLVLSLAMLVLVYVGLLPLTGTIPLLGSAAGSAGELRAELGTLPTVLLFPPVVSFLMLGFAAILSVFKPWRRTPWSRDT